MRVKVLLRGFAPGIPKDKPVTFKDSLPASVVCVQCGSVSAELYRDANDHGYCALCLAMCMTVEDGLECSTCGETSSMEDLLLDWTIRSLINKQTVICPNSNKTEQIDMPFHELKAHLKVCRCESGLQASNTIEHDEGAQSNGVNSAAAQQCSVPVAANPISMYQLVNDLLIEVRELQRRFIDKDNGIKHLKGTIPAQEEDMKSLQHTILKINDDIQLLKTALSAFREDIRSVQICCENRISHLKKLSADFTDQPTLLLETLDFYEDELKKELKNALATAAVRYKPCEKWSAKRKRPFKWFFEDIGEVCKQKLFYLSPGHLNER
ncbi:uncharacterized protein LOC144143224 [Haemaphysalis longicornis]